MVVAQEPALTAFADRDRQLRFLLSVDAVIFLLNIALASLIWRLLSTVFALHRQERVFLESIGDGVVAIDRSWKITLFNKAAERMTGWREDEVLGRPFRDHVKFLRERDRKENLGFIEEAMLYGESRPMANSTLLVARDGREIPIGDSASPIFGDDGVVAGVIIIFRDVTSENLARSLRTDFAYASHQLRTPINKALWHVEALLERVGKGADREHAVVAYRSLKDVRKLSEALLEVSRIDQGMINVSPGNVEAKALIGQVLDESREAPAAKDVAIDLDADEAAFDADPKLLNAAWRSSSRTRSTSAAPAAWCASSSAWARPTRFSRCTTRARA